QRFGLQAAIGKRIEERARQPRPDTSRCCNIDANALQPATACSLGLDLATSINVTFMTSRPEKIPTGVYGPLQINGQNCGALVIGRSSTTVLGLFVLPGIIDADYTGEIQVMAHTPFPPLRIEKGQRIAQLVPLPQMTRNISPKSTQTRGHKGFGSTGVALLAVDLKTRPKKSVDITYNNQTISLRGLLDTGADNSIISPENWPAHWPQKSTSEGVTGIGGFTLARKTPLVTITIDETSLSVVLSIVPLPPAVQCLIGRDILGQLGVVL
ncbi:POK9 protein, partial [Falcunculus frontatus]|nr:POK9 protein [Falcunculus frontatus]